MKTRAKFYLSEIKLAPGQGRAVHLKFTAVSRGTRNTSWSQYTPSGELTMYVTNPVVVDGYLEMMRQSQEAGKQPEFYLDIIPSEDGWAGDGHKFEPNPDEDQVPENSAYSGGCLQCGGKQDDARAHPNG